MFSSRSPSKMVGRKAEKKTARSAHRAAREQALSYAYGNVNRVMRIGAFSRVQSKKLPWVEASASELAVCLPVNADPAKRLAHSFTGRCCGGDTRPSGRLADCQPGYTSFSATAPFGFWQFRRFLEGVKLGTAPFGSPKKAGATTDPRYGCSVNTAERVGRLTRFTNAPSGRGGLNGLVFCAQRIGGARA